MKEQRESFKILYLNENAKKLQLKDFNEQLKISIKILREAIAGLEKDCNEYEDIINKLEQHIKKQDIKIASLRHDLKEPWLKEGRE